MLVIWSDVFEKFLQGECLFADWSDDEISILKGEIHGRAILDLRLFGVGLWDAKREAVAPFLHGGYHGISMDLPMGDVTSLVAKKFVGLMEKIANWGYSAGSGVDLPSMAHPSPNPSGRFFFVGLRRWKAASIGPILNGGASGIRFVSDASSLRRVSIVEGDNVFVWGAGFSGGELEFVRERGGRIYRVEDGFIRSVGLGSDFVRPLSLVVDESGLYFDPSHASDLETILNTASFTEDEIKTAETVRHNIVQNGITKYNIEPRGRPDWGTTNKRIVLVPGQVEDDASIRLGCSSIRTNLGLLRAVRSSHPDAFIVYKPHPDVRSGNRSGVLGNHETSELADHVETQWSVVSCIEACAEVHTMTSLCGFDALLRGKRVVTYGQPFYAGWGLTCDMEASPPAFARRLRRLSMSEMVAGTLLRYPIYWDWTRMTRTTCENVLESIKQSQNKIEQTGDSGAVHPNFLRRTIRKFRLITGPRWQIGRL